MYQAETGDDFRDCRSRGGGGGARTEGKRRGRGTWTYTCFNIANIANQLVCLNLLETAKLRCKSFAVSEYRSLHSGLFQTDDREAAESRMGDDKAGLDL